MTIRKTLTQIIAIIMVAVTLFGAVPFTVFANTVENEGEQTMSIIVSSEAAMPGETIEVTVSVENNPGIASLKFDVEYDDTVLTLTEVVFSEAFGSMVTTPEPYASPQPITMISPLEDNTAVGVFATLTFSVNENAPDGYVANVNVVYSHEDIFNGNDEEVPVTVTNGKVSVFRGIPGDVDGNRKVNTKDAIALFRHVAGWTVDHDPDALDVNGDGKVNTKDAIQLFRYVAGWPDIELYYGPAVHRHDLILTDAKEATCTEDGNILYFYCSGCDKYFNDITATNEIKLSDTVIASEGHDMNQVDSKDPNCLENGCIECWTCTQCGKYFADENGNTVIDDDSVVIPSKGHDLTEVSEKSASCTVDGNVTYWHCENCNKNYIDDAASTEIKSTEIIISAKGHALQHIEAKPATCTENGNIEYWYCSACKCYFVDVDAKNEVEADDVVVSAIGHGESLVHVTKKDATVDEEGNIEYWHCTKCNKFYTEADATNEIEESETVIGIIPSYTITFFDEKNWPNGKKVKFAQSEGLLLKTFLPPEVIGYEFKGWLDMDGNPKAAVPANNTADITLVADWDAIEYNIIYKNAAENPNVTSYTIENEVILLNPRWAGLAFSHWTNEDGEEVSTIPKGTTGEVVLEANWKYRKNQAVSNPDKYTYIGGVMDSKSRYHFIYDIGSIENLVLAKLYGTKYEGNMTYKYQESKSYKVQASESKIAAQTIANFVISNQEWTNISQWMSHSVDNTSFGAQYCPEIEYAGIKAKAYEFTAGWNEIDEEMYTETDVQIDQSVGGGEIINQTSSTISFLNEEETSETVTLEFIKGVSPEGYYSYVRAVDVKVYAIVTYDPATGEYYLDIYSQVYRVFYTPLFELTGDEQYTVNIESNNQLDFEIPYEQIPNTFYTVQYDNNGGTGEMFKSVHEIGQSSSLLVNKFTRDGYIFAGWKTTQTGEVALYSDASSIIDIANAGETITLYAHWVPITYTIQYNGNGATSGSTATSTHAYDTAKTLTANGFSRTGYTFLGWSENKDATTASYGNKSSVKNIRNTNGAVVTLCAIWKANTYTVTLDANGGTADKSSITVTYDGYYSSLPTTPTRSGYYFLGWYDGSIKVNASTLVTITGNQTLCAKWLKTYAFVEYTESNGMRNQSITDSDRYTEFVYSGLDPAALIQNGFTKVTISCHFDGYEKNDGYQKIWIYNYSEGSILYEGKWDMDYHDWDSRSFEFTVNLTDINTDGSIFIRWGAEGNFDDDWKLGYTSYQFVVS